MKYNLIKDKVNNCQCYCGCILVFVVNTASYISHVLCTSCLSISITMIIANMSAVQHGVDTHYTARLQGHCHLCPSVSREAAASDEATIPGSHSSSVFSFLGSDRA